MTEIKINEQDTVDGVVKWFDLAKGFGFIVADGITEDVLLHANIVRDAERTSVSAGDRVRVTVTATAKGVQASTLLDVVEPAVDTIAPQNMVVPIDDELLAARLKWFDKSKGYGFLNAFGMTEDIFVHVDTMRNGGMLEATVGEAICVVVARGAKGASATAVYPWDSARVWQDAQS